MTGFMRRASDRYREAGGTHASMPHLVERVLADERARGIDRDRRSGLSRAAELAVIARLRN